jgi:hypothetical protein
MRYVPHLAIALFFLIGLASGIWLFRRGAKKERGIAEHSVRFVGCTLIVIFGYCLFMTVVSVLIFSSSRG